MCLQNKSKIFLYKKVLVKHQQQKALTSTYIIVIKQKTTICATKQAAKITSTITKETRLISKCLLELLSGNNTEYVRILENTIKTSH